MGDDAMPEKLGERIYAFIPRNYHDAGRLTDLFHDIILRVVNDVPIPFEYWKELDDIISHYLEESEP